VKRRLTVLAALLALVVALGGMRLLSQSSRGPGWLSTADGGRPGAPASSFSGADLGRPPARGGEKPTHALPHAIRDPAKREELRRQLLAAIAAAQDEADAAAPGGGGAPAVGRGQRETNDVNEFGRFVTQAVNESFVPMAQECANELRGRRPDAGGAATVAFKLLGDDKVGGVVDSAEIVRAKSTIDDVAFATCIRESLYGVYFDPPPVGGEATLDFEVRLDQSDGGVENVDDFHPVDKR
jgi:hypothetical protein